MNKYTGLFLKLVIGFFVVMGFVHLWYSMNYCEVELPLRYDYCGNETVFNSTIFVNYHQLSYFVNSSFLGTRLEIPQGSRVVCGVYLKKPIN